MTKELQNISQAAIVLEAYNPSWDDKFAAEKKRLIAVAGDWLYGSVEHVGSTAVPGMIAKPIIDIMFGVKSLELAQPAIIALAQNGYKYWPYKPDVMHWFCKPSDEFRTHHLHLVPFESPLWNERLRFRNLLRSNSVIANGYANLKQELAITYKNDRDEYTKKKWPYIQQVLHENKLTS
ncbi:GrpB family protein [Colwellia sp. MB3u-55]|jgi:GrpB-like predicted nucleotidyltransferase (UPF0157 family)|uniref:GrpB family protein n=1 Tax=Colwellia sp. MB3u-55 TaxID=2759810 RepID=UPI0015F6EC9B|nr:GrpB family protein [Colwellia sp. MB3u-55]MBA6251823.1 GrpB family protein [Colwellia sp. MB3u-55]